MKMKIKLLQLDFVFVEKLHRKLFQFAYIKKFIIYVLASNKSFMFMTLLVNFYYFSMNGYSVRRFCFIPQQLYLIKEYFFVIVDQNNIKSKNTDKTIKAVFDFELCWHSNFTAQNGNRKNKSFESVT